MKESTVNSERLKIKDIPIILLLLFIFFEVNGQTKSASKYTRSKDVDFPNCLIGYSELQTNLPGGRQANVNTMRAVVIRADGTGRQMPGKALAQKPNYMTQFVGWSPHGEIAIIGQGWKSPENAQWEEENKTFRHTEGNMQYDSYLIDIKNGAMTNPTAVARVSHSNTGLFFWPGDSTKLGFTALINGVSHPFKMDRDGKNKMDLSRSSAGFTYGFSASKNGKYVAYHKDYQVYIADADGSNARKIDTGNNFNFAPQWSPDGQQLLFVSGKRNTQCDPYLVNFDGSGLTKLADRNGYKGAIEFLDVYDFHEGSSDVPVWSADGKSIFYTALIGSTVELFQITPGHLPVRLTKSADGALHYHPNPSPDGKWLLFGAKRNGVRQLYIMDLTNFKEKQLTKMKAGTAAMWAHWQPGNWTK